MSLDKIKRLREATLLGIGDCKKALLDAHDDFDRALDILKQKGAAITEKKQARATSQGVIDAYVHFGGNLAALVEVNCETDFVARTEVFRKFVKDLSMQIAATSPKYIKQEDMDLKELENIEDKEKYIKEVCLMDQPFIKDSKVTIGDYLRDVIFKMGENIVIKRFVRFSLGAENEK